MGARRGPSSRRESASGISTYRSSARWSRSATDRAGLAAEPAARLALPVPLAHRVRLSHQGHPCSPDEPTRSSSSMSQRVRQDRSVHLVRLVRLAFRRRPDHLDHLDHLALRGLLPFASGYSGSR